jgi:hypothetical protein
MTRQEILDHINSQLARDVITPKMRAELVIKKLELMGYNK